METPRPRVGAKAAPAFNAQAFLDSAGLSKKIVEYGRGEAIFTQGDPCEDVLYIQTGGVKLSVLSKTGREAVVAMIGPGDFFGEGCLIDQLFNSSEKRLARTLLLLARYGTQDKPARVVPKVSQETLAEMVGTTRSRVNFFLNKFKKLGFIEYTGGLPLKINSSLLSVVLHD